MADIPGVVSFYAPYSQGLPLRWNGYLGSFWKRHRCIGRKFHRVENVSNQVGRCSSMEYEVYHCVECDSYFDEAYFKAMDADCRGYNTGYDGTSYVHIYDGR